MREWGCSSRGDGATTNRALFDEPGLFLTEPDGKVCHESILSTPAGRQRLDGLLDRIDYWTKVGYPARGDA